MQQPHTHLRGNGCPFCKESKLERKLKLFFEKNDVEYKRQYVPNYLGQMKLDFYLPKYNIAIECQGVQHIRGTWYEGSHDRGIIIPYDIKKNKLCNEHDLLILYLTERKSYVKKMLEEEKFKGIYTEYNTFTSCDELLEKIKGMD